MWTDWTAVRSGSALFVQACLSKDLGSLRYSLNFNKQNGYVLDFCFSEADWLTTLLQYWGEVDELLHLKLYITDSFSNCDGLVDFPPFGFSEWCTTNLLVYVLLVYWYIDCVTVPYCHPVRWFNSLVLKMFFMENLTFDALVEDVLYRGSLNFETDGRRWVCTHALTGTHRQTDRQTERQTDRNTYL